MNVANFIFRLLHICNLPTLVVLTPTHLPCTPSINYTHLSTYNDNTFVDCTNFYVDCANKYDDCVNMPNDWVKTIVDSIDTHDRSFSESYIPNPSLL